jgi:hypothetical protein
MLVDKFSLPKTNILLTGRRIMAITLPTGKWTIHGNEEEGELNITGVDAQGKLTATAFGDKITGSFNTLSGEISFTRRQAGAIDTFEVYTGYISTSKAGGGHHRSLLGGSYSHVIDGVVPLERYGWYATKS